ncbi:MAG: rod shape-determining protein MreC [Alphaproteobacteria bacterium]|nr:rod shape-determining protein MreC [Alphaproteobacteria bacterium]
MSFFIRHKKSAALKPKANPYPSRSPRWRYRLGFTLIAIGLLGGILRLHKPFYDGIEQRLFEGTAWIQAGFIHPFQETRALLKNTHVFMHLREEYERLSQENEKLKWQLQTLGALHHENGILRQHLHIPIVEQCGHLTAKILSSPYDGLHHFFLIASGDKDGIEKEQPVIVKEGVVGRLEKVGAHVSRVLLLNDSNSRIPVITSTSQQKAILAGDGTFLPTLVYVGDVRKIQQGEQVLTSGMGGIFPAGLPVGIVDEITNNKIRVRPYVPFKSIEWVHILRLHPEGFREELNAALRAE